MTAYTSDEWIRILAAKVIGRDEMGVRQAAEMGA
jgi:hypothetical protein